jgi:hypothetical protein
MGQMSCYIWLPRIYSKRRKVVREFPLESLFGDLVRHFRASALLALALLPAAHAANPVIIQIKSQPPATFAAGFSGVNMEQPRDGVEFYDPLFVKASLPLKAGLLRYPGGTVSLDFDWNPLDASGGHTNVDWMNWLLDGSPPLVGGQTATILPLAQQLTQAKGGVNFSDYATFANTLKANSILCFNSFTDTNHGSATQMVLAAQSYGLNVVEWELGNEAYLYPAIYPTASSYAAASNSYFNDIVATAPAATVGLFAGGWYPGTAGCGAKAALPEACYPAWDQGLYQSSTAPYWNAVSDHIYPILGNQSVQNTMFTLNGVLAHGSSEYIDSYMVPLAGPNTPIFITELNCCTTPTNPFLSYLYNGIFLAEYIARLSSVPNVKGVAINSLYTDSSGDPTTDYHGLIQSVNDFESYLLNDVYPGSTNTAANPNTKFFFYMSAPGLAMEVANQAINSGTRLWPTTVSGGPTVNIVGFDGNPIPAIYAQMYLGNNGKHYLLVTNKSSQAQLITIELNGVPVAGPFNMTYVANSSPTAANTVQSQMNVQIQTATPLSNPFHIAGYSVTTVMW